MVQNAMSRSFPFIDGARAMAVLLAGCGGDRDITAATLPASASEPSPAPPSAGIGSNVRDVPGLPCSAAPAPIDASALIDDMEDGDGTLANVAGRNGTWWVSGDDTPGAEISPAIVPDVPITAEAMSDPRCGSQYAMHVRGHGFDDWGASLAFSLRYDAAGLAAVDLREYAGVSFWARVGEGHDAVLRVGFQDINSSPPGGRCDGNGGPEACYDTFGTEVQPLSYEWQNYQLYFDRLAQRGVGLRADALEPQYMYGMEFSLSPGRVFDLWIDDIELF
jgi:hypothetical protein